MAAAVLQFPLYGAIAGWGIARDSYLPAIALAALHIALAVVCFAGVLPDYS